MSDIFKFIVLLFFTLGFLCFIALLLGDCEG